MTTREPKAAIVATDQELLSINEAAAYLRTPVATLRWWRHLGVGPHSFKIGRRVVYWPSDLHAWVDEQHGQQSAKTRC